MKYIYIIIIINYPYIGCSQAATNKILNTWNTALVENLEWQKQQVKDSFYLRKVVETIDFYRKDKDFGTTRKDLVDKLGTSIFDDELTVIYVTDIHNEYIYLIKKGFLYQYDLKKEGWLLIKKKECSKMIEKEVKESLINMDTCSDEPFALPLYMEINVTYFANNEHPKAIYLIQICKQHIDLLRKLNTY